MNEKDRKNAALTLYRRLNDSATNFARGVPVEHLVKSDTSRYIDPLILYKTHDKSSPDDREDVAMEDPIACRLTFEFHAHSWAQYPKFYETDEVDSFEIMPEVREFLMSIKFHRPSTVAGCLCAIHGWSVTKFWTEVDQYGMPKLRYYIFSEKQCNAQNIIRDKNNKVVGWNIYRHPRLPLGRNMMSIQPEQMTIMRNEPGVIFLCRGDEEYSRGFGFSYLEAIWDSLVKLREESHANAMRARVFPISVVPPEWSDDEIDDYFDAIKRMDQSTALVTRAGKNSDGTIEPLVPSFNWISPGTSAQNKSSEGGSSAISSLSSEWARLCSKINHNLAYFFGGGTVSASMAAAGVDAFDDVQSDIEEFNMYRDYIVDFVMFCMSQGMPIKAPPYFCVKCHWEWKRDEQYMMQTAMAMTDNDSNEGGGKGLQVHKEGENRKPRDIKENNDHVQEMLIEAIRTNGMMPMQTVASSTVHSVGYQDGDLYVAFHKSKGGQGSKYKYKIGDPERAEQMAQELMAATSKGGYVWDMLRGETPGPAWGSGRMIPGGTYSSIEPYEKVGRIPLGKGYSGEDDFQSFDKQAKEAREFKMDKYGSKRAIETPAGVDPKDWWSFGPNAVIPKGKDVGTGYDWNELKSRDPDLYQRPEPTGKPGRPAKGKTGMQGRKAQIDQIRDMFQSAKKAGWMKMNEQIIDMSRKRFNEFADSTIQHTFGNDTIDKIKAIVRHELFMNKPRYNSIMIGTPMDFTIDLYYPNPRGGIDIERACKKAWKKNVTGKMGISKIYHDDAPIDIAGTELGSVEFGWDDTTDTPTVKSDIDRKNLQKLLEDHQLQGSRLYQKVVNNEPLPISTEYICDLQTYNGITYQTNFRDIHLALVDQGNCPDNLCSLREQDTEA